jgi:hypothetical protein
LKYKKKKISKLKWLSIHTILKPKSNKYLFVLSRPKFLLVVMNFFFNQYAHSSLYHLPGKNIPLLLKWSFMYSVGWIRFVVSYIAGLLQCSHWNNSLWVDMSQHSDTLSWFRVNQSLLFLLNAVCLAEKQQIPIL